MKSATKFNGRSTVAATVAANVAANAEGRPVTVPDFLSARSRGVRLTMLTAYDSTMTRLLDTAGVDGIGDCLPARKFRRFPKGYHGPETHVS